MPSQVSYVSVPRIAVGGNLNTAVMGDLVSLDVEEDVNGMSALEMRLLTQGPADQRNDHRYLDRTAIDFGTQVAVTFGDESGDPLFAGRVSAIGAELPGDSYTTVVVKAEDALADLRRARRTRTFEESSTADIAQRIAGDHGLTPQVDVSGPTRPVTTQLNLSDLAFLRTLAQAEGAEVWLDGTTLHLQRRADRDAGTTTLMYGADLRSFAVTADLAHQCTDLTVAGWSVDDKDVIAETAGTDALGAELDSDTSGADILKAAFSERHERLVLAVPLAADDARTRATAAYLDRARRFVTGAGTSVGNPALRVGTLVTLRGIGAIFTGDYRVVRTRHRFDLAEGYQTDIDVERVGLGAAS